MKATCGNYIADKIIYDAINIALRALKNKIYAVILYGSYARGDYTENSDIDIAIIADIDESETIPTRAKLFNDWDIEIIDATELIPSITILNSEIFNNDTEEYIENIKKDGVVFYEQH